MISGCEEPLSVRTAALVQALDPNFVSSDIGQMSISGCSAGSNVPGKVFWSAKVGVNQKTPATSPLFPPSLMLAATRTSSFDAWMGLSELQADAATSNAAVPPRMSRGTCRIVIFTPLVNGAWRGAAAKRRGWRRPASSSAGKRGDRRVCVERPISTVWGRARQVECVGRQTQAQRWPRVAPWSDATCAQHVATRTHESPSIATQVVPMTAKRMDSVGMSAPRSSPA